MFLYDFGLINLFPGSTSTPCVTVGKVLNYFVLIESRPQCRVLKLLPFWDLSNRCASLTLKTFWSHCFWSSNWTDFKIYFFISTPEVKLILSREFMRPYFFLFNSCKFEFLPLAAYARPWFWRILLCFKSASTSLMGYDFSIDWLQDS